MDTIKNKKIIAVYCLFAAIISFSSCQQQTPVTIIYYHQVLNFDKFVSGTSGSGNKTFPGGFALYHIDSIDNSQTNSDFLFKVSKLYGKSIDFKGWGITWKSYIDNSGPCVRTIDTITIKKGHRSKTNGCFILPTGGYLGSDFQDLYYKSDSTEHVYVQRNQLPVTPYSMEDVTGTQTICHFCDSVLSSCQKQPFLMGLVDSGKIVYNKSCGSNNGKGCHTSDNVINGFTSYEDIEPYTMKGGLLMSADSTICMSEYRQLALLNDTIGKKGLIQLAAFLSSRDPHCYSIEGKVFSNNNKPINATIEITSLTTITKKVSTKDINSYDAGTYQSFFLPAGRYTVKVINSLLTFYPPEYVIGMNEDGVYMFIPGNKQLSPPGGPSWTIAQNIDFIEAKTTKK